jgi:hypothetical protein
MEDDMADQIPTSVDLLVRCGDVQLVVKPGCECLTIRRFNISDQDMAGLAWLVNQDQDVRLKVELTTAQT